MFYQGDLIWAQTHLYPLWPCVIKYVLHDKNLQRCYRVRFLGGGRNELATIRHVDAFPFDVERKQINPSPEDAAKYKNLKKGIKEAIDMVLKKEAKLEENQNDQEKQGGIKKLKKTKQIPLEQQYPPKRNIKKQKVIIQRTKNLKSPPKPLPKSSSKSPPKPPAKSILKVPSISRQKSVSKPKPEEKPISEPVPELKVQNKPHQKFLSKAIMKEVSEGSESVSEIEFNPTKEKMKKYRQQKINKARQKQLYYKPVELSDLQNSSDSEDDDSKDENSQGNDDDSIIEILPSVDSQMIDVEKDLRQDDVGRPTPRQQLSSKEKKRDLKQALFDELPVLPRDRLQLTPTTVQQILSNYFSIQKSTNPLNQVQELKLKLQCLALLIVDQSANKEIIRTKLFQFITLLQKTHLSIITFTQTQIHNLLSLVLFLLPPGFIKEIDLINQRLDTLSLKDYLQLCDFQEFVGKLRQTSQPMTFPALSNRRQKQMTTEVSEANVRQMQTTYYKSEVSKMLDSIKGLKDGDRLRIVRLIVNFMSRQCKEADTIWNSIKEKMKKQKFKSGQECLREMSSFVKNIS